jgi:hypothetical protein
MTAAGRIADRLAEFVTGGAEKSDRIGGTPAIGPRGGIPAA